MNVLHITYISVFVIITNNKYMTENQKDLAIKFLMGNLCGSIGESKFGIIIHDPKKTFTGKYKRFDDIKIYGHSVSSVCCEDDAVIVPITHDYTGYKDLQSLFRKLKQQNLLDDVDCIDVLEKHCSCT